MSKCGSVPTKRPSSTRTAATTCLVGSSSVSMSQVPCRPDAGFRWLAARSGKSTQGVCFWAPTVACSDALPVTRCRHRSVPTIVPAAQLARSDALATASRSTAAASRFCRRSSRHEGFKTEADLVEATQKTFCSNLGSTWKWLHELESPAGIADLVALKLAHEQSSNSLSEISPRWAYALKCLPYLEAFTVGWFSASTGVTKAYAQDVLSMFESAGYCQQDVRQKTWLKLKEPRPIANKIVAVEAKLRDWRRALYQASQYLDYATRSWVVLDMRWIENARDNLEQFTVRGVGLLALGVAGDLEVVAAPADRPPRMIPRFWQANAEIARRISTSRDAERSREGV